MNFITYVNILCNRYPLIPITKDIDENDFVFLNRRFFDIFISSLLKIIPENKLKIGYNVMIFKLYVS